MVVKLHALFDKDAYEKGRALDTNAIENDNESAGNGGEIIKAAIKEKLESGKVGSLTVDPQYLDFEALACKL